MRGKLLWQASVVGGVGGALASYGVLVFNLLLGASPRWALTYGLSRFLSNGLTMAFLIPGLLYPYLRLRGLPHSCSESIDLWLLPTFIVTWFPLASASFYPALWSMAWTVSTKGAVKLGIIEFRAPPNPWLVAAHTITLLLFAAVNFVVTHPELRLAEGEKEAVKMIAMFWGGLLTTVFLGGIVRGWNLAVIFTFIGSTTLIAILFYLPIIMIHTYRALKSEKSTHLALTLLLTIVTYLCIIGSTETIYTTLQNPLNTLKLYFIWQPTIIALTTSKKKQNQNT